jgi:hypothetical protein
MDEERNELESLPRELAPPPQARSAIAAGLRRERLLRRRRAGVWAVAAALTLIVLTVLLFPTRRPAANYVLLLYESPQFTGGSHAEYAKWAEQMRPLVAGGEELDTRAILATSGAPSESPTLGGYFLIRAGDDATAVRVARACPHLRHGGSVVLRKIVN